jgi:uncharacterized membrane protein
MSKKGNEKSNPSKNKNQEKIAAKKAAVLGTESKNRMPLIVAAIGVVLIAGAAIFYVFQGGGGATATASAPAVTSNTFVSFPVSLFEDGKARHFEHVDGNMTIRYFILKSSDGIIRAAFDACDVCWPAGKGYYQEGDNMVCRNCGRRFASVLVNEVQGGCNPAPLNRNLENNKLVIQIKDIQQGRQYFNFDGKA